MRKRRYTFRLFLRLRIHLEDRIIPSFNSFCVCIICLHLCCEMRRSVKIKCNRKTLENECEHLYVSSFENILTSEIIVCHIKNEHLYVHMKYKLKSEDLYDIIWKVSVERLTGKIT